ncbi:hypothetical protein M2459_001167 [Parabacteroides sp. PF5-5]|uniref:hypothetical protein n=1 Tax=unclassified Parabacteroides TaxID=2649774 RepID=UPI0024741468|nr:MULTISPECIES: hypothetical protein [unclassified Parabacteroides]MDH6304434.1 hypothetical protein [Parabacteroides sp. PH5-39]MDH6315413.1 hypothetical protein [Parabacteroides sp. PF5-13]MDH6319093.1 hypothetical protein [Parabacteroides sp. PH5-13]MDH6322823.1 hypothetical protein [Parabacteroides sp. PH5-8]MDH6326605.1 hypothetical protein [Parabacteroides sp. PH5-41]
MKNLKYLLFLFILPALFTACEDDQIYDGPARVKFEKTTGRVTIPLTDTTETVRVQLVSAPLKNPIDVKVTVSGGTAEQGKHFDVSLSDKLTIPAGENIVSFDVKLYYSAFSFLEERTIEFTLEGSSAATEIPGVNKFTLTAVPVATLTYTNVGKGVYSSTLFDDPDPTEVEFERCDQLPNNYKMIGFFTNPIEIKVDPAKGTAVIEAQDLGDDLFGEGTNSWLECTNGRYAEGIITFEESDWDNVFYTSEGMSSGAKIGVDIYTLPAGSF